MAQFAVIQTGGKQYRVAPGQKLRVEKLEAAEGSAVHFDQVLLVADGDNVEIGTPTLKGAKVDAKVIRQGKEKTKIVFKYHSKSRYRKKRGHRQPFTEVEITKITA